MVPLSYFKYIESCVFLLIIHYRNSSFCLEVTECFCTFLKYINDSKLLQTHQRSWKAPKKMPERAVSFVSRSDKWAGTMWMWRVGWEGKASHVQENQDYIGLSPWWPAGKKASKTCKTDSTRWHFQRPWLFLFCWTILGQNLLQNNVLLYS